MSLATLSYSMTRLLVPGNWRLPLCSPELRHRHQFTRPTKTARRVNTTSFLTAWGDHQIKLASASAPLISELFLLGAAIEYETAGAEGEDLSVKNLIFNDGGTGSEGSTTYLWQQLVGTTWTNLTAVYGTSGNGYTTDTLTTIDTAEGDSYRCRLHTPITTARRALVYSNAITMIGA